MGAKYWIKLYHETTDDPKVALLPDNLWRRFIECCILAGRQNENGFLPPVFDIAFALRLNVETTKTDLSQLAQAGLLELKLDSQRKERWYVSNFEKRQAPSSNAERVRQWRQRQKEAEAQEKIEEIETEADTDNIVNGYSNVTTVTKSYSVHLPTDLASPAMLNAWGEWQQYHIDRGSPLTKSTALRQFQMFYKWGEAGAVAAIDQSIANGWVGLFPPKAAASKNGTGPDDTMKRLLNQLDIEEADSDELPY